MKKITREEQADGQILRLTLNAPKGNVLDSIMMNSLAAALREAEENPNLKCIVFQGAGEHFSFGASVEEHTKENAPAMLRQFHGLFFQLMDLSVPTAALISGQCLGGGFELALACDFLFADSTAVCGQPEIRLGVFAPPASLILPFRIGQQEASRLLLSGDSIPAERLKTLGLTGDIYPDRPTMEIEAINRLEKMLVPKSASSLKRAVRASRWQLNRILRKGLPDLEDLYIYDLMETNDANEGIQAFLERRKPNWGNL
ncbi:MAG: enoyl-CoA hydratase-related protein [Fidelibacterota bacterium]